MTFFKGAGLSLGLYTDTGIRLSQASTDPRITLVLPRGPRIRAEVELGIEW